MPEKILYIDCPTGLAGDMLVAALCDGGADIANLKMQLDKLALKGWHMESKKVLKNGLAACQIKFHCAQENEHRHLHDIISMIEKAGLPTRAARIACRTFFLLAEAEAKAHGCSLEEVHFHEVGAVDAILDICAVALAIEDLGISKVYCSLLPHSEGFVECAHGRLPLPAPAVLNLLSGYSFFASGLSGELITPTGAALLTALKAQQFFPSFTLEAVGLGAGNRDLPVPNILRVLWGHNGAKEYTWVMDEVDVLTANIDDAGGEVMGYLLPLLLEAGALDACFSPLIMKKGRPAWQLQVICSPHLTDTLAEVVLSESCTLGLRMRREQRRLLSRSSRIVITPQGKIKVKISGNSIAPEYEDVAKAARANSLPFQKLYRQAQLIACQEEEE
ncbi:MAG: nickel pincer cofactor biosynthesis protein LarC [Firmicutes bacterium]|nr:nickel pincer cofactor biosynthesis protein LarC [Bacillota bacterium]